MRRAIAVMLIGGSLGLAAGARAEEPAPGRYAMQKSDTGIARLDTQTGEVSLCQEKDGQLVCRMAADQRARLSNWRSISLPSGWKRWKRPLNPVGPSQNRTFRPTKRLTGQWASWKE